MTTGNVIIGTNMDETEDWYFGGTFFGGDSDKAAVFPDAEAAASMVELLVDIMEGVELRVLTAEEAKDHTLVGSEIGAPS